MTALKSTGASSFTFQSTHPRRVWHRGCAFFAYKGVFQSTHPRRVWLIDHCFLDTYDKFQSTHPRRVWPYPGSAGHGNGSFNPHTHEGCDTADDWKPWEQEGFNPHTHEGCDITVCQRKTEVVSFNPHTHEGCDPYFSIRRLVWFCFNPHTHEGCDKEHADLAHDKEVSIHTPTKGVTLASGNCRPGTQFQSTHPRRVWQRKLQACQQLEQFQSTHPRRVWRLRSLCHHQGTSFNPHTHEGCDLHLLSDEM